MGGCECGCEWLARGCKGLQAVPRGWGAALGVKPCEGHAKLVHPSPATSLPPRPRIETALAHEAQVLPQIHHGASTQRLGWR